MVVFSNAKINIGLNILEKRTDGFHNIETVFYPIPLTDILEIIPAPEATQKTSLNVFGLHIDGDASQNLCAKAYTILDKDFHLPPVKIILQKIVPMGAGLGGGSSNGAYTLILLNKIFELRLSEEKLIDYASKIGSDCAFFIKNKPSLGTEKGGILQELSLNLKGYHMILVKPDIHVGTSEAYGGVKPHKPDQSIKELIKLPVKDWNECIVNDFEASVFQKHQEIKKIKDDLYNNGAVYASMTGSGSAVFGLFESKVDLKELFKGMFYWEGLL
jgi:4-diphosphocytidyl-2-C-methyl-D-erythritol kinase